VLILSRRANEQIVLPTVGVTIELLGVKGSATRVGIKAPKHLPVLRGELAEGKTFPNQLLPPESLSNTLDEVAYAQSRKRVHQLRNQLNIASMGMALVDRHLQARQVPEAQKLAKSILQQITSFQEEEPEQQSKPPTRISTLLVEDEPNERRLLAGFLRMAGFEVATAPDGEEAINYLNNSRADTKRTDIVLMDMMMPKCDGPTAIRTIRENPAISDVTIFALSGASPDSFTGEAKSGIDRWFQKPLDPESLVGEISRAFSDAATSSPAF